MHQRLHDKFNNQFPNFVGHSGCAEWGMECGSGWGLLLYAFFLDADTLCRETNAQLEISQIKEKFGTLRLYCALRGGRKDEGSTAQPEKVFGMEEMGRLFSVRPYPTNPALADLIDYYESLSAHCCELCGRRGHIDEAVTEQLHWVKTLCFDHANLLIARRSFYDDAADALVCVRIEKEIKALDAELKRQPVPPR